jgi:hypothetical protein
LGIGDWDWDIGDWAIGQLCYAKPKAQWLNA